MTKHGGPMKILRVITRLNIGGPALQAILLTRGLDAERFRSILVTGVVSPGEGDMGPYAVSRGVVPSVIPEMKRDFALWTDVKILWKLYRLCVREKPDIIHTHTTKAGGLGRLAGCVYNVRARLLGQRRARLVHTFHGHVFRGYFSAWKSRLLVFGERMLAVFTDRLITVSEGIKRELVDEYRITHESKISVVPLGLDFAWVNEIPQVRGRLRHGARIAPEEVAIGIVGRLTAIKNHALFLAAARTLRDEPFRFLIIGEGELRQDVRRMVEEFGLNGRVVFTGWQRELANVYADLDIVCLTSLNEGTPAALIEAMAAGRPIVGTDVGGVRDLMIGEGVKHPSQFTVFENGILTEPNDAGGLASALRFLARDAERREAMGKVGQELAKERYSFGRLLSDIEQCYVSLVGSRR